MPEPFPLNKSVLESDLIADSREQTDKALKGVVETAMNAPDQLTQEKIDVLHANTSAIDEMSSEGLVVPNRQPEVEQAQQLVESALNEGDSNA